VCFPAGLGDRSQSELTTLLGDSFVYGGPKNPRRAADYDSRPSETSALHHPASSGDRSQSELTTLLLGDSLVYGGPKNPRRATDYDSRPSETSAPHHPASLAYGPPQTSSAAAPSAFLATFVHNDLHKRTHVFLRKNTMRRAL
jgi:hypothetical protein